MNYNTISTLSQNAYGYFKAGNSQKFLSTMKELYKKGNKNPSVTLIVMNNTLHDIAERTIKTGEAVIERELKDTDKLSNIAQQGTEDFKLGITLEHMEKAHRVFDMPKSNLLKKLPQYKKFYNNLKKLYPNSLDKRLKLIERNAIDYRCVKTKTDWVSKIALKPLDYWRKLYPKTYSVRERLILEEQIKEGEITPKLKDKELRHKCKKMLKMASKTENSTRISKHQSD